MDECARRILRSSQSEGGCFGGLRRRNEGYRERKPLEASLSALYSIASGILQVTFDMIFKPNSNLGEDDYLIWCRRGEGLDPPQGCPCRVKSRTNRLTSRAYQAITSEKKGFFLSSSPVPRRRPQWFKHRIGANACSGRN